MAVQLHCGYRPGAIGRLVHLHAQHYSALVGFGLPFESRVARELAQFCERLDPLRDGLWLAMQGDQIVGSIAIDGLQAGTEGAHLRWFIVEAGVRGTGVGHLLMRAAMDFCAAQAFRRVHLSTFEGLDAARHLYEKFGFTLVAQQAGAQWGRVVQEQRFEREA